MYDSHAVAVVAREEFERTGCMFLLVDGSTQQRHAWAAAGGGARQSNHDVHVDGDAPASYFVQIMFAVTCRRCARNEVHALPVNCGFAEIRSLVHVDV